MTDLDLVARRTFDFFRECRTSGMVRDNAGDTSYASVAGMGFGLLATVIGCSRGWITQDEATESVRADLELMGHVEEKYGFLPHFLETKSGKRWRDCEISTLDTALWLMGCIAVEEYFKGDIASQASAFLERVDWSQAINDDGALSHGWRHGRRISYSYKGYNEALFMYLLALGSSDEINENIYDAWVSGYQWKRIYGIEYLYGGPLFLHQTTQSLIDCRGIRDDYMEQHACDYFENSKRATLVQREYGRRQQARHGYSETCWGLTANDGPGGNGVVDGRMRRVHKYRARGAPYGPDDGTMAPWAMVASLPFASDVILSDMDELLARYPVIFGQYGYKSAFHPSLNGTGWVCDNYFAIDQGSVLVMLENYRNGSIWDLVGKSRRMRRGLARAGFRGGWLDGA